MPRANYALISEAERASRELRFCGLEKKITTQILETGILKVWKRPIRDQASSPNRIG